MPWVRFIERFDYSVRYNLTIRYRAGTVHLVKQDCADRAIRAGKAAITDRPKRQAHAVR